MIITLSPSEFRDLFGNPSLGTIPVHIQDSAPKKKPSAGMNNNGTAKYSTDELAIISSAESPSDAVKQLAAKFPGRSKVAVKAQFYRIREKRTPEPKTAVPVPKPEVVPEPVPDSPAATSPAVPEPTSGGFKRGDRVKVNIGKTSVFGTVRRVPQSDSAVLVSFYNEGKSEWCDPNKLRAVG